MDAVTPRHLHDLISTFRPVTHIGSLKASSCRAEWKDFHCPVQQIKNAAGKRLEPSGKKIVAEVQLSQWGFFFLTHLESSFFRGYTIKPIQSCFATFSCCNCLVNVLTKALKFARFSSCYWIAIETRRAEKHERFIGIDFSWCFSHVQWIFVLCTRWLTVCSPTLERRFHS